MFNIKHTTPGSLPFRNSGSWDPFHITADLKYPSAVSIADTAAYRSPLNPVSGFVRVHREPDEGGLVRPFVGVWQVKLNEAAAFVGNETKFML